MIYLLIGFIIPMFISYNEYKKTLKENTEDIGAMIPALILLNWFSVFIYLIGSNYKLK